MNADGDCYVPRTVIQDVLLRLVAGLVVPLPHALLFQVAEETLHDSASAVASMGYLRQTANTVRA